MNQKVNPPENPPAKLLIFFSLVSHIQRKHTEQTEAEAIEHTDFFLKHSLGKTNKYFRL